MLPHLIRALISLPHLEYDSRLAQVSGSLRRVRPMILFGDMERSLIFVNFGADVLGFITRDLLIDYSVNKSANPNKCCDDTFADVLLATWY